MKATYTTIMASLMLIAALLALRAGVVAEPPKQDSPEAGTTALSKEDDKAVRKVIAGFGDAWNTHDMKAFSKLFREDAEWINVVGMHWHGRDAIVAATTAFHETIFKNNQMKIDSLETRSLGAGYAIAVATITVDGFTTPSGQVRPKSQDRETFVLVKGPEGWKLAHGHNTVIDADAAKHDPVNGPGK
jgi:uncharacterized protein (TIGR02246 family)